MDDFDDDEDFLSAISNIEKPDIDSANNNNITDKEDGDAEEAKREETNADTYAAESLEGAALSLSEITEEDENHLFQSTIKGVSRLPIPDHFPFPFPPYSIQVSAQVIFNERNHFASSLLKLLMHPCIEWFNHPPLVFLQGRFHAKLVLNSGWGKSRYFRKSDRNGKIPLARLWRRLVAETIR